MGAAKEQEKKGLGKLILRILFSHVGLFLLVCGYAVGGAYLFIAIELPAEETRYLLKQQRGTLVNASVYYLSELFWHYQDKNYTHEKWIKTVVADLNTLRDMVVDAVEETGYDKSIMGWEYNWSFAKSLLFTITIMTTVGYGHISPQTWKGKLVCILYSLIGIPLLLIFLANVGDAMASSLKYAYSRGCCRWCRYRRKKSEVNGDVIPKGKRLIDEEVGQEEYMPTDSVDVPIVLTLVIIAVYIALGAVLFSNWEGWDMITASYFSFVTLSTIGFGDYVPGSSFLDYSDGFGAAMKMLVTVLYCLVGMALVSMAINLMQEQILAKIKWFALEIGLTTPSDDLTPIEIQRRRAKLMEYKKGQIQTPAHQTGNRIPTAKGGRKRRQADPNRPDTASLIRSASASSNNSLPAVPEAAEQAARRPITPTQISVSPVSNDTEVSAIDF